MSSELRAIRDFNPRIQVYLDVSEQHLVNLQVEESNDWPEDSKKRVIEYLENNPLKGDLKLDFLNWQTSTNLSDLLYSLGYKGSRKVEFEMFKFLMRNASSYELSEFQLSTLCVAMQGIPFDVAVAGAKLLRNIPDDRFEDACEDLVLIHKEGKWDLIRKFLYDLSSDEEIEFYLKVTPKLIIGGRPNLILESLSKIPISDRGEIIKYFLEFIVNNNDSIGRSYKIIDVLAGISKSDLDDVVVDVRALNISSIIDIAGMLAIISLIPKSHRDINYIKSFYKAFDQIKSESHDKFLRIFKTFPEIFRFRIIKFVSELNCLDSFNEEFRRLAMAFGNSIEVDPLKELLNVFTHLNKQVWWIRTFTLVNISERSDDIFPKIIESLKDISSSDEFERIMNLFKKVSLTNRNLEILKSIQFFLKEVDEGLGIQAFESEIMEAIKEVNANDLGWILKRASDLVLMYGIWNINSRIEILKMVIKDSEIAHTFAENLRRTDQVRLAIEIMESEPDTFDQLMKQFIEEIELYLPFCDDSMLFNFIQSYPNELSEALERRFESMTQKQQEEVVFLMKPTQFKRLFDHEASLLIMNQPGDSHSKFCIMTMNSPETLYEGLSRVDNFRFTLFLRFLDKAKFPNMIHVFSEGYARQASVLKHLLKGAESGEDVSDQANKIQMWCGSISIKTKMIEQAAINSGLENDIQLFNTQIAKVKDLIQKIELCDQNIPQKFLDSLTLERMKNPVKVPTSDVHVDQSTLHNPKYFEAEMRAGVIYRKNPYNTLFYPDYTSSARSSSQEQGYEIDEALLKEIQNKKKINSLLGS